MATTTIVRRLTATPVLLPQRAPAHDDAEHHAYFARGGLATGRAYM